jgi:hypothetical protein
MQDALEKSEVIAACESSAFALRKAAAFQNGKFGKSESILTRPYFGGAGSIPKPVLLAKSPKTARTSRH